MSDPGVINEEPPDENEAYESLDESLDDDDALGHGPEGERGLDTDILVDQAELEEVGAQLDDPDEDALEDDPEPIGVEEGDGWVSDDPEEEDPVLGGGTSGEVVDTAVPQLDDDRTSTTNLDNIPDDAPGPDSARW